MTQGKQGPKDQVWMVDQELKTELLVGSRWVHWRRQAVLCVHSPNSSTFLMKWRHGRHLKSVTLNRKSDSINWCVYLKNSLAKFHPDPFEMMQPSAKRTRTTRWVAVWDKFLIQKSGRCLTNAMTSTLYHHRQGKLSNHRVVDLAHFQWTIVEWPQQKYQRQNEYNCQM